jgi:peptide/nickel transport system substrate-binding protein
MNHQFSSTAIYIALAAGLLLSACAKKTPWQEVERALAETKDIIVLDRTDKASLKYTGASAPGYGDWMVRHFLSDPENFNPYTSNDSGASTVNNFLLESLLYPENTPPYALKGMLAVDYPTISEDKLSYTFKLREGIHFADGKPMTADDVLFSMKTIQNPRVLAPHLRNYYSAIKDVVQHDKRTITFVCNKRYFRNDISLGSFDILPRHFYDPDGLLDPVKIQSLIDGSWETGPHKDRVNRFAEQFNQNYNRKSLGSGPYTIADWENDVSTGQKVVLTRNEKYWGKDIENIPPPGYVDKIVFKIINNTDAAFIELTNGNLDRYALRPLEFKDKSWSPEFMDRFMKGINYSSGYTYIGWNNAHPLFKDKKVRKALTHLTNRGSLVKNLLFGLGEAVESPIHKFRPEYNHDLESYDFDPDTALKLLEEAGWKDTDADGILDKEIDGVRTPFKFEFLVNSGNQIRKDIALSVQYELQDIGISCEVRELDWTIFLERIKNKNFDACTLGWTDSLRFPPDAYQIWHSSQVEGTGSNFISFINKEVDQILEDYRQEFDMDKRIEMYRRFQEILHEEQPYTFLWKSRVATAYSRRFAGVNWYPIGQVPQEWWVDPADRLYQ